MRKKYRAKEGVEEQARRQHDEPGAQKREQEREEDQVQSVGGFERRPGGAHKQRRRTQEVPRTVRRGLPTLLEREDGARKGAAPVFFLLPDGDHGVSEASGQKYPVGQ